MAAGGGRGVQAPHHLELPLSFAQPCSLGQAVHGSSGPRRGSWAGFRGCPAVTQAGPAASWGPPRSQLRLCALSLSRSPPLHLRPPDAAGSWSWARLRLQPLSGSCLQVSGLQGAVSPTSPSCPQGFAKSSKLRGSAGWGFCGMGPWSPGWWPVTHVHILAFSHSPQMSI